MDFFEYLTNYIPYEYILIVIALVIIGEMLKKFTVLPNQFLTTVLPILGAVVMVVLYVTGVEIIIAAEIVKHICIGLLMGWAATGGYEFLRNFKKSDDAKKTIAYKTSETTVVTVDEDELRG